MATARQRKRLHSAKAALAVTPQPIGVRAYNSAALQKSCITHFLARRGAVGALRLEIEQACDAPCVTKRISELRRDGVPIQTGRDAVESERGQNRAARYFLLVNDPLQRELFPCEPGPV